MPGKPVIRGARITVELIPRKLSEGATTEELLDGYPRLTREDIQAALACAAGSLAHETIVVQRAVPDRAEGHKGACQAVLGNAASPFPTGKGPTRKK
ncbi:MAG: DUF433 domain-containing protein [Chloroflexi bacterium]|nr:DUF433 domain-containing protein [Chloroflexota bacterium]